MSRNYKFHNKEAAYFVSFATGYWIDVFTRQLYLGIIEESLQYCRMQKGMVALYVRKGQQKEGQCFEVPLLATP